ncbi:hypothetical protein N781_07105 [Pontibacillus halophilus JSM 076056 = DSM 19796]|uniref:YtkA-like domain-containing protein n=1 Tax=Pontibacillus halophilus JSM 076056 = DSM 19796 TaxID=1385510 RepID=A0A0A5GH99_9BACI|nr:FixH family protein [Pontibacillus halophilus]KGX90588.1 hypothetical protein N781_07105 [Pontibacillus halophilus JSM 076056 = DSM 19796]
MRKFILSMSLLSVLVLAACGESEGEETNQNTEEEAIKEVVVEFTTAAETIQAGEETVLQAEVTYGNEESGYDAVEDADVEFEVLQGENTVVKEKASSEGEGMYTLPYTFEEAGTYTIIPHTNAKEIHTMPSTEVTVEGTEEESHAHSDVGDASDEGGHDHHSHGHGHGDEIEPTLTGIKELTAGSATEVKTQLQKGDEPVTDMMVRYEIWKVGAERHMYIDTTEANAGEYVADVQLDESGTYVFKLHYENDEVHGHTEQEIEVN